VYGANVSGRTIGPVFHFTGSKIGYNFDDRFMVAMSAPDRPGDSTLAVITQSGDVYGANVSGQNIGPLVHFTGAKIGYNPQDRFMVAMNNTLFVITEDGDVYGANISGQSIGAVVHFTGAKLCGH
jgi:hypothetical protein